MFFRFGIRHPNNLIFKPSFEPLHTSPQLGIVTFDLYVLAFISFFGIIKSILDLV